MEWYRTGAILQDRGRSTPYRSSPAALSELRREGDARHSRLEERVEIGEGGMAMEHVAKFGSWGELYVMLGTSSAALIGLLFVATSLHVKEIVNNSIYRTLARSGSIYLLVTLAIAASVLTPQPAYPLGIEIAVL